MVRLSYLDLVLELTTTLDQLDYTCLTNLSYFGATYDISIQIDTDYTADGPRPAVYNSAKWFGNTLLKLAKSPSANRTLAFIRIQLDFAFRTYRSKYNDDEEFRQGASLAFSDYKNLDRILTQESNFPALQKLTVDICPITYLAVKRLGEFIEGLRGAFPKLQQKGMLVVQRARTSPCRTCVPQVSLISFVIARQPPGCLGS